MKVESGSKIKTTDMEKNDAISTFISVSAMAKIKVIFKRYLKRVRERMRK